MADLRPYDAANIPGPKMAKETTPQVVAKMMGKAKRPLLVVGMEALEGGLLAPAIELGRRGIPIAATAHSIRGFREAGYTEGVYPVGLHELTNCLLDPEWAGLDGNGSYDLVLFYGITYYYASQMMAALKNFAPHLRAVSIDRYYHPNAEFSYGNLKPDELVRHTRELVSQL